MVLDATPIINIYRTNNNGNFPLPFFGDNDIVYGDDDSRSLMTMKDINFDNQQVYSAVEAIDQLYDEDFLREKQNQFWKQLVSTQDGIRGSEDLEKIRDKRILIAGAGAVGGTMGYMLARLGFTNIIIADPDEVTPTVLGKQPYRFEQIGQNKSDSLIEILNEINPNGNYSSVPDGITIDNIEKFVDDADVIIDAIDIFSLDMVVKLHEQAHIKKKRVIIGYDLGSGAMVEHMKYDLVRGGPKKPLHGKISVKTLGDFQNARDLFHKGEISDQQYHTYVQSLYSGPINPLKVPNDLLEFLARKNTASRVPQLPETAFVLGPLGAASVMYFLLGRKNRNVSLINLENTLLESEGNIFVRMIKRGLLLQKVSSMLQTRQREMTKVFNSLL